jgi:RHS repeat-associated protein
MLVKRNFFFSKEECEEIIVLCEKVGVKTIHKIDAYNKWDILRIHNDFLKEKILKKYKEVFLNDTQFIYDLNKITIDEIYVSLTRYYDGRFLEMHRDTSSDLTSVIVLTDNFTDGRFVLSDEKISIETKTFSDSNLYSINQGNGLTFMRARYYDVSTGRFTNPDPIGINGEDTNLYRYIENSPPNYIDPLGTSKFDKFYGLPKTFWNWLHRQDKKGPGDYSKEEARELFKEWERLEKPLPDNKGTTII